MKKTRKNEKKECRQNAELTLLDRDEQVKEKEYFVMRDDVFEFLGAYFSAPKQAQG